jgi:hypothetical protein
MLETVTDNALMEEQDSPPRGQSDDHNCISVGSAVGHILFLVAVLVVINIPTEGLGLSLTRTETGVWIARPLLQASPSGLNLWLTLCLALWVVNLHYGRWQRATRWADIGLSVLGVLVLGELFQGVLSGLSDVHALVQPGRPPTTLAQIVEDVGTWSMLAVSVALAIALVHMFVGSVRKVVALARPKRGKL